MDTNSFYFEQSLNRFYDNPNDAVWEVVLVSHEIDRYNTKINPRGFVGTPSTTTINYNHGGVATGAVLKNVRAETNYATGEYVNGIEVIIPECCVGEIHVPKTAQMNFRASDGTVKSAGSLYDAMLNQQGNKVSVGFNPVKGVIIENGKETIYNLRSSAMAREFNQKLKQGFEGEYREWELPELSVLDINSGQAHSKSKRIRSLDTNNPQSMQKFKKGDELCRQTKVTIVSDPVERDGKVIYSILEDGKEREMEETEVQRMYGSEGGKDDDREDLDGTSDMDQMKAKLMELENKITNLETKFMDLENRMKTDKPTEPQTGREPPNDADDQTRADQIQSSNTLANLIRKNPELLNQIEDEREKAKYARSLNLELPKPNPSKEPASQFDGEVSSKDYTPLDFQRDLRNHKFKK